MLAMAPFMSARAAAVDPALLHRGIERIAMPPLPRDRHDVVVGVEVDGLFRAGVPEGDDVVARVIELIRLGFLLQAARDGNAAHLQAKLAQGLGQQSSDFAVVFAGRIDRTDAHQLLQEGNQGGLMALEVIGGGHGQGCTMGYGSGWRK